jgi:hypothetical protein
MRGMRDGEEEMEKRRWRRGDGEEEMEKRRRRGGDEEETRRRRGGDEEETRRRRGGDEEETRRRRGGDEEETRRRWGGDEEDIRRRIRGEGDEEKETRRRRRGERGEERGIPTEGTVEGTNAASNLTWSAWKACIASAGNDALILLLKLVMSSWRVSVDAVAMVILWTDMWGLSLNTEAGGGQSMYSS